MAIIIKVSFAWWDFWIGAYWDRSRRILYVCPLPMFVFSFSFQEDVEEESL